MKHAAVIRASLLAMALLAAGLVRLPRGESDVRIASKKFTESVILGEVLRLVLEDEGLRAMHYRELGGTRIVFDALVAGEIDVYPEYIGTIAAEILAGTPLDDEPAMRRQLAERGIGVSKPLGFNNSYGIALTRSRAAELGVHRVSDLRRWPELKMAFNHEFLDRADGWPALRQHYDLPQRNVFGVDHDVAYRQLLAGEVDATEVYTTDAMIQRGDLLVLEDDREFFPRYDAVWLYRLEAAQAVPSLARAVERLADTLDEPRMRQMNDEVESRDASESQAAAAFLRDALGVEREVTRRTWTQLVSRHVLEHLDLVRRSFLPAIVAGVLLGVVCQRWKRTGQMVMAGVGLLQTIPSLALLVMLMPLVAALGYQSVGEGSVTAVVALFAYCLLPIVRNTYAGLENVPRGVVESATVLGLNPTSRLVEIELPISLPTILAGVRTAGIQNVGFATLGAIIGAGGLGQPILRGIRLNDLSLILAGAIPAAVLALLLQGLIDLVERLTVSPGLRRTRPTAD